MRQRIKVICTVLISLFLLSGCGSTLSVPDDYSHTDGVLKSPDSVKSPDRVKEPASVKEPSSVKEPAAVKEPKGVKAPKTIEDRNAEREPVRPVEPVDAPKLQTQPVLPEKQDVRPVRPTEKKVDPVQAVEPVMKASDFGP